MYYTNLSYMFYNCSSLSSLNLSNNEIFCMINNNILIVVSDLRIVINFINV